MERESTPGVWLIFCSWHQTTIYTYMNETPRHIQTVRFSHVTVENSVSGAPPPLVLAWFGHEPGPHIQEKPITGRAAADHAAA
jgi:hypothetical protein